MIPIVSDLKERAQNTSPCKHREQGKNAYRKQHRYSESTDSTEPVKTSPSIMPRKPRTPVQVETQIMVAPAPVKTFGSYLPSLPLLCGIALVIALIVLIRNKQS